MVTSTTIESAEQITADSGPALLTIEDIAKLMQLSTRTVYRMSLCGELPAPIEIGPRLKRWRRDIFFAWLQNDCQGV